MWTTLAAGIVALLVATDLVETQACRSRPQPTPTPPPTSTPAPTPPPGPDVFTTQDGIRFRVETLLTGLQFPWSMAFAPDGRLFVTERPGRVRILDIANPTTEPALTLSDVFAEGEAGVLGVALDPEFTQSRLVYIYYTARLSGSAAVNRVVRCREVSGRLVERVVLIDNIPAAGIHDGGRLRFGPDGLLYITNGDAANTARSQDLGTFAGKILRINRDGTTPRTNRFGSPIFTYGHRNPQGIDWHPVTGDLWGSEHGNVGNDEVNVIDPGDNYGWPTIEGNQTRPDMRAPITSYSPAIAPSGASFYRGQLFPGFVNNFFVATLRGTHILRIRIDPASPRRILAQERLVEGRFNRIRDVISGPDGFLYFCTSNGDDRIARIVPAS
jgi:glucose/arabinose dehydrogenase